MGKADVRFRRTFGSGAFLYFFSFPFTGVTWTWRELDQSSAGTRSKSVSTLVGRDMLRVIDTPFARLESQKKDRNRTTWKFCKYSLSHLIKTIMNVKSPLFFSTSHIASSFVARVAWLFQPRGHRLVTRLLRSNMTDHTPISRHAAQAGTARNRAAKERQIGLSWRVLTFQEGEQASMW